MKRSLLLVSALSAAALLAACGGGGSKGTPDTAADHINPIDVPYDNTPSDLGDRDNGDTGCAPSLSYADPMEMPVEGYHYQLVFNGQRDIRVKVTACDAVVKDVDVTFEETEDAKNLCSLESLSGTTGDDGIAFVRISSPQEDQAGDCKVKACLSDDNCLLFNVRVEGKNVVPLVVGFAPYTGTYPQVKLGKVFIFKNAANSKPNCADLKLDALPTANDVKGPVSILTTVQFPTLKDLAADKETSQVYTILCTAFEEGSTTTRAYGCVDDANVELGARTFVECPLEDIPPKIVGSYDITSTFDMVSGLPPTVATVINHIIGFFTSPTGEVMMLMCDPAIWQSGAALQDLCDWVFLNPSAPAIDELTSTGEIVRQIVDALLVGLLQNNCPYPDNPQLCEQIYFTGKDIGDILKKFTLQSTMTCSVEPDKNGLIALGGCSERWHTVILKWTLGKDCPPGDDMCGAMVLSLDSIQGGGATVVADIEAQLLEKNTKLAIAKHKVNLKYGILMDYALEKILLPQVFGDGSDGLPAVDSFEAMIGSLLAGKACLVNYTCCEDFALNLTNQAPGLTTNLVEGACDALITVGSEYIRKFLTDLDTTPDNFSLGTPTDKPCAIYDTNKDMKFDALGKKPEADRCEWDATLTIGAYDYKPLGNFYGARQ